MGAGSGVSAGYEYVFPRLQEPYATQLRIAQEKRKAFQMSLQFPKEFVSRAPTDYQEMGLPRPPKYPLKVLNELENLDDWSRNAVNHIFLGEVKLNGKNVSSQGFHYAQIRHNGNIIVRKNLRTTNAHGVYRGNVIIRGVKKNAFSTFFPRTWSPQQTVNEINYAYKNKKNIHGKIIGQTKDGIKVVFRLNKQNKIISAYPEYEE